MLSNKFTNLLQSDFSIDKLNKKIESWFVLEWPEFEKELKKKKITLLGMQKDDWYDRFSRLKEEVLNLKTQIIHLEREIDQMVYELYGLTDDEIKIVEEG